MLVLSNKAITNYENANTEEAAIGMNIFIWPVSGSAGASSTAHSNLKYFLK